MAKIVLPLIIWGIIELIIAVILIAFNSQNNLAIYGIGFFGISALIKIIYVALAPHL